MAKRGANPETVLSHAIQGALNDSRHVLLWRNNVGGARTGTGGFIRYGLCPGSADLVGLVVGSGRFLAVEIKLPGGRYGQTEDQARWQALVERDGGLYVIATSALDVFRAIGVVRP